MPWSSFSPIARSTSLAIGSLGLHAAGGFRSWMKLTQGFSTVADIPFFVDQVLRGGRTTNTKEYCQRRYVITQKDEA